ncbi:hypothetical protein PoB_001234600 [Plakobranchus ocellatus]|uniref:Reverse transcriptase RNase H-like domain-containing protein n=1 Tax=Plakobranchus ocellatus TaxID=259542 RepID=A0AAV3YTZ6_9GAST|nr:hypothetical protein PoB_001234600 [Plakobranchus ocellatus]
MCGPVEETTCSYERELMAVIECLRVFIRRQREGAALPGVVIYTDCRALEQAFGGSGSENVGRAVVLGDYLQKTERVRTVVQWLLSHNDRFCMFCASARRWPVTALDGGLTSP